MSNGVSNISSIKLMLLLCFPFCKIMPTFLPHFAISAYSFQFINFYLTMYLLFILLFRAFRTILSSNISQIVLISSNISQCIAWDTIWKRTLHMAFISVWSLDQNEWSRDPQQFCSPYARPATAFATSSRAKIAISVLKTT